MPDNLVLTFLEQEISIGEGMSRTQNHATLMRGEFAPKHRI